MKVYVILVLFKLDNSIINVSSECYRTVEAAEQFILNRSDNPKKHRDWVYIGENNTYVIKEIEVK